jgi:hypothetical protein
MVYAKSVGYVKGIGYVNWSVVHTDTQIYK